MEPRTVKKDNRPFLLDVTRLVWRVWKGRFPTGVDRVCLAYMQHFGARSLAMLQRGRFRLVLSPGGSDRLFALLRNGGPALRRELPLLLALSFLRSSPNVQLRGRIYLNVGHTGVDAPGLGPWLKKKGLLPVYLVHDLIPITHPEFCRAGESDRHKARMRAILENAAGVIANSRATLDSLNAFAESQALMRRAALPPSTVAMLGGGNSYRPLQRVNRPKSQRPQFVIIGTIEGRKNHALLLKVWDRLVQRLGEEAPELLIVGQRGWAAEAVFAALDTMLPNQSHVHEMRRCDDDTMHHLIDNARAVLMPSFAEGFGIPVMEALQRGTPVIAADLPVYRELAGDIPLYLDPNDIAAWEQAVIDFMSHSSPEQERQVVAMHDYRAPDWDSHFTKVERFLTEIGKDREAFADAE